MPSSEATRTTDRVHTNDYIAYIGSIRVILIPGGTQTQRDGHLIHVKAPTVEDARAIGRTVGSRIWPESEGWLQPLTCSCAQVEHMVAMQAWTAENAETELIVFTNSEK